MEPLAIIAIVIFTALVLFFVALTCSSCLQYNNNNKASAAPATFDGLTSGSVPARASRGEGSLEDGRLGLGGTSTHAPAGSSSSIVTGQGGQPNTLLPVRHLSRRLLKSLRRRRDSSEEETSARRSSRRPPPFLENDPQDRLPSYRFLFRAPPPPPQQTPPGDTAIAGDARGDTLVPLSKDQGQGSRRSLASYFSKSSPSGTREAVTVQSTEEGKGALKPVAEDEPRRRFELPQFASRGSLASWHGAPPPEYLSMKKVVVEKESPLPRAHVSMKNVRPNASSVALPGPSSSSAEVKVQDFAVADNSWHLGAAPQESANQTIETNEGLTPKSPNEAGRDGETLPNTRNPSPPEEVSSAPAGGKDGGSETSVPAGEAEFKDYFSETGKIAGRCDSAGASAFSSDGQGSQTDLSEASEDQDHGQENGVSPTRRAPAVLGGRSSASVEATVLGGPTPTAITMSLFSTADGRNLKDNLHSTSFKAGPDKYAASDDDDDGAPGSPSEQA